MWGATRGRGERLRVTCIVLACDVELLRTPKWGGGLRGYIFGAISTAHPTHRVRRGDLSLCRAQRVLRLVDTARADDRDVGRLRRPCRSEDPQSGGGNPLRPLFGSTRTIVNLVRRFPEQNLRRKQFEFEDAFRTYIDAEPVLHPRPPGSSPDLPRFQISDGKRSLTVSDSAVGLSLVFESVPPKGMLPPLLAAAERMDKCVHIYGSQEKYFLGLVIETEMVFADSGALYEVYRGVIGRDPVPGMKIFSYSDSVEGDGRAVFLELSHFHRFNINAMVRPDQPLFIDTDFVEPGDAGLKVKIDINTKPSRFLPGNQSFVDIVGRLPTVIESDVGRFLGPDVYRQYSSRLRLKAEVS